ncbi:acetyl-CoA carboxylase biotin carboxyl carrier protein subunit [Chimaeribacter californicus]|uniref:Acetyl-CoA carboxylase biotin carboxyl carrier protein subunit n=1 Tax=Chimaeribacter californicus TaxID=2060067 RepID=A0A2N5E294_9GAMM|nr:biotin/lipoyl-containing protein [Chimaeribacter californicus]PLR34703.1 acetyl-CoA carboxylase biotin carboxyl carrier protein subunit [Chimaeribacter californicus]
MEKNALALDHIRQLAKKMHASGLHEIELHNSHWSLTLRYPVRPAGTPLPHCTSPNCTPPGNNAPPEFTPLPAPMPGRVVLRHPQQDAAWVQPGQRVKQHELLALLKVGALYLPLRSPVGGVIARITVEQDQAVEFGSPVMLIAAIAGA